MRPAFSALVTMTLLSCTSATTLAHRGSLRDRAGDWEMQLIDEYGSQLPTIAYQGRTFVAGSLGQRYSVRVINHAGQRVEAVVSVDGRDAIDGSPASWNKNGYVIDPYDEVTISGFRLDLSSVAAFRFSAVAASYAARMGSSREVGVVGVAVFPERPEWSRPAEPMPPPYDGQRYDSRYSDEASPSAGHGRTSGAAVGDGARQKDKRSGLGTEFGERRMSEVRQVEFRRARPGHPDAVLGIRYDDRSGLIALGVPVDGPPHDDHDLAVRQTARPFPELDRPSPSFSAPPPGWRQ